MENQLQQATAFLKPRSYLCVQHDGRKAARRAGMSAASEIGI